MTERAEKEPKRPAIRNTVKRIPLLPMVEEGPGTRIELKIVYNPEANGTGLVNICGLTDRHTQARGTREGFARWVDVHSYLAEVIMHLERRSRA